MLILVRMLMRCLRKSGLDRRHMAEAALAMREATHEVVDYTVEEVWCNDTSLLHASLDGELF